MSREFYHITLSSTPINVCEYVKMSTMIFQGYYVYSCSMKIKNDKTQQKSRNHTTFILLLQLNICYIIFITDNLFPIIISVTKKIKIGFHSYFILIIPPCPLLLVAYPPFHPIYHIFWFSIIHIGYGFELAMGRTLCIKKKNCIRHFLLLQLLFHFRQNWRSSPFELNPTPRHHSQHFLHLNWNEPKQWKITQ